jgi:hypothetical protein
MKISSSRLTMNLSLLIVLLVVFAFAASNLSTSLVGVRNQLVNSSGSRGQATNSNIVTSNTVSNSGGLSFQLGNFGGFGGPLFLYAGIATTMVLVSVLLVVFLRWRKRRNSRKNTVFWVYEQISAQGGKFFAAVVLGLIVLLFIGIVISIRFLNDLFNPAIGNGYSLRPLSSMAIFNYLAIGVIVGLSFGALLLTLRARGLLRSSDEQPSSLSSIPKEVEYQVAEKEFKNIIDRTVYSLGNQGSGLRATIIQCYSAVLALFEKSGMHQEESLTPRELEAEVSARLGFSSENLHQLTALFERARYSAEELSSQEAERALFYFKQLSEELESREQSRKNAMMSVQTEHLALTKI